MPRKARPTPPGAPPPRPQGGRPNRLDEPALVRTLPDGTTVTITIAARVCELVRLGISHERAALLTGIAEKTFYNWRTAGLTARRHEAAIAAGTRTDPLDPHEERYARFLQELEEAVVQSELDRVLTINGAQIGGARSTRTTRKTEVVWLPDPDAPDDRLRDRRIEREVERTETVTTEPPQWTAAAWWLERRMGERYGRRVDVAGVDDKPLKVEVTPAQQLRDHLATLRERSASAAALSAGLVLEQATAAGAGPDPTDPLPDPVDITPIIDVGEPDDDLTDLGDLDVP